MTTPVPSAAADTVAAPCPLVYRMFGEPRFHSEGEVAALAFVADGSLRAVDEGGVLRHWTADGRLIARHFLSDLETVWSFGPGALVLGSGNDDLLLWDAEGGQLVHRLPQDSWVTAVAFGPGGRRLVSGSWDTTALVWDVSDLVPGTPRLRRGPVPGGG